MVLPAETVVSVLPRTASQLYKNIALRFAEYRLMRVLNIRMKIVNQILSLAPTPLFIVGGIVSWLGPTSVCSTSWFFMTEMTAMWFVMALAHVGNWIVFLERRRYVKLQQLPVKQQ